MKKVISVVFSFIIIGSGCSFQHAKALAAEDFGVRYNSVLVSVNDSPDKMIAAWGRGNAKDDDDAFIGSNPAGTFREYEYVYPLIDVQVRRGAHDFIYFMHITELETNRGIKKGNSYRQLIRAYGKPTKEDDSGTDYKCEYSLGDDALRFDLDSKKNVIGITVLNYASDQGP